MRSIALEEDLTPPTPLSRAGRGGPGGDRIAARGTIEPGPISPPPRRRGGRGVRSFLVLVALAVLLPGCARRDRVRVASKEFPESVILGDMVSYLAADAGAPVEHARS